MATGKIRASTPGSKNALKRELKESSGGDKWFYRVPADSELKARFMVEPWEFISYQQHFVGSGKDSRSFPCNDGDCVGCDEGYDANKVWVAPIVDIEEKRVRAMVVPKSIVDALTSQTERHGTIMDRDYYIVREGSGKDNTKYRLDSDGAKRRDMSIYDPPDIMAMLESQLEDAQNADDDDDEPPRRSGGKTAKKAVRKPSSISRSSSRSRDDVDDDDDEPPWEQPARKSSTGAARKPIKKIAGRTLKKSVSSTKRSLRR